MSKVNVFLILNLGCEMLYVIDQRLKAQSITVEKSAQVFRDLTCVLLDSKFLAQFLHQHPEEHLLTPHQMRILLSDIACCSLMRLDIVSMDKLWDLMVMVFKWQVTISNDNPQRLVDITFRHINGIGRLIPETRKTMLIDCGKRLLIENWDSIRDKNFVVQSVVNWLQPFSVKISILIRLGFQRPDTLFGMNFSDRERFQYYVNNVGENIYAKHAYAGNRSMVQNRIKEKPSENSREIDSLVEQLNINRKSEVDVDEVKNCSILDDVSFIFMNEHDECSSPKDAVEKDGKSEFVCVERSVTSKLWSIMEQFRLESNGNADKSNQIDVTAELLKMLDENSRVSFVDIVTVKYINNRLLDLHR